MTIDILDAALIRSRKLSATFQKAVQPVAAAAPRARRFVFDKEASIFLGRFIRTCGDLIIANRQFAIPPFETVYIEFDMKAMMLEGNSPPDLEDQDTRVGYLIEGRTVYCVAATDRMKDVGLTPFVYEMDTDEAQPDLSMMHEQSIEGQELLKLSLMLGSGIENLDEKSRVEILARNVVRFMYPITNDGMFGKLVQGSAGDLRNVWAILLLLNQPANVTFDPVPARRGIFSGKLRTYAAHNIVRIDIGRHRSIRRALAFESRSSPRRHEVRGHFAHYHLTDGCQHEWQTMPDEKGRWLCGRCDGYRVWRKNFLRGDAGKGFVTKSYEIGGEP